MQSRFLSNVVSLLVCPICREDLTDRHTALACHRGHSFDIARSGYVNLARGTPQKGGDTAPMVEARAAFLDAGHFAPVADRIAELARGAERIVEVGAGTAYYLSRTLDRCTDAAGIAVDSSRHAASRAARAHRQLAAIVADAEQSLPLRDGTFDLALSVFAPRPAAEVHRILSSRGHFIVARPTARHLQELMVPLGLLQVDPRKEERLHARLSAGFVQRAHALVELELVLPRADCLRAAMMGPSAFHVTAEEFTRRAAALADQVRVTLSVAISLHQRT